MNMYDNTVIQVRRFAYKCHWSRGKEEWPMQGWVAWKGFIGGRIRPAPINC